MKLSKTEIEKAKNDLKNPQYSALVEKQLNNLIAAGLKLKPLGGAMTTVQKSKSDALVIRPVQNREEIRACAEMMAQSEPWLTMKRDAAFNFKLLSDPKKELYVAAVNMGLAGHLLIDMNGPFAGYVQVLAVHPDWRSQRVGAKLMAFAEERIFRDSPNVFLCVAEFNKRAQSFYAQLGYELIGPLKDYVNAGSAELLMRKTVGPKATFRPK